MKSTAGFILGLIGGILSIIWGILNLLMMMLTTTMFALMPISIPGLMAIRFIVPVIIIIGGILAIWGSILMKKEDNAQVKKGGILTLIGGAIGFNILSIIGGILGLVSSGKTAESTPQIQTTPQTTVTPTPTK